MKSPDTEKARILLIDDDDGLREVIQFQLEAAGHTVHSCASGAAGIAAFEEQGADAVLTDLKMPGIDGMGVLKSISALDASVPVLVLTAFGSVDTAVAAMRAGAHDYLTKPFARDALLLRIERAVSHGRVLRENRSLRKQVESSASRPFLAASPAMERLMEQVERVASADLPVLLSGESGTGKELVARQLHRRSPRASKPFVAVNCAAIPSELLEAELFGHAKGAFTGAGRSRPGRFRTAEGGTLLLDEIGDLPLALQPKLLRVLQERAVEPVGGDHPVPVDVRIIAATHRDLAGQVRDGTFREDLYYRLAVIPLLVPPLRQRREEIGPLFELFLREQATASGRSLQLSPAAVKRLKEQRWQGNVRQLENLARRVALLAPGPVVEPSDLPLEPGTSAMLIGHLASEAQTLRVQMDELPYQVRFPAAGIRLNQLERALVTEALDLHGGNKSAAARFLGIKRHILLYRIEKYEIGAEDDQES